MATLAKIWGVLQKIPAAIWLGLSIFGSGILLTMRVMSTRYKVKNVRDEADRRRADIAEERESLRDAAEDGTNERLREELLRGIKK